MKIIKSLGFVWEDSFNFSFLFLDVKDQFYCYYNNDDCRLGILKNNDARCLDFLFKNQGLVCSNWIEIIYIYGKLDDDERS